MLVRLDEARKSLRLHLPKRPVRRRGRACGNRDPRPCMALTARGEYLTAGIWLALTGEGVARAAGLVGQAPECLPQVPGLRRVLRA